MRLSDFLTEIGRPVAYYPSVAKVLGGVREAIFLCQFAYWQGKEKDDNGWIYKSQWEIEKETGLNSGEQREVRLRLKKINILSEKKVGLPAVNHYYFNWEVVNGLFNNEKSIANTNDDLSKTLDIFKSKLKSLSLLGYDRAKNLGVKAELVDYATVFKDHGGICHVCGKYISRGPGQRGEDLQFDHIAPLSQGGNHTYDNVKPTHARCNLKKGDTTSHADSVMSSRHDSERLDDLTHDDIQYTEITPEITTEIAKPFFSKNQLGKEEDVNPESNSQNDVLEQASRNLPCIRRGGLEHISISTEKAIRVLGRLPRHVEGKPSCKRCDGIGAITIESHGRVYGYACPCVGAGDG